MSGIFNKLACSLPPADSHTLVSNKFASHPPLARLFTLDFPNLVASKLSPVDRLQVVPGLITNSLPQKSCLIGAWLLLLPPSRIVFPPGRADDEIVYFLSPVECCFSSPRQSLFLQHYEELCWNFCPVVVPHRVSYLVSVDSPVGFLLQWNPIRVVPLTEALSDPSLVLNFWGRCFLVSPLEWLLLPFHNRDILPCLEVNDCWCASYWWLSPTEFHFTSW